MTSANRCQRDGAPTREPAAGGRATYRRRRPPTRRRTAVTELLTTLQHSCSFAASLWQGSSSPRRPVAAVQRSDRTTIYLATTGSETFTPLVTPANVPSRHEVGPERIRTLNGIGSRRRPQISAMCSSQYAALTTEPSRSRRIWQWYRQIVRVERRKAGVRQRLPGRRDATGNYIQQPKRRRLGLVPHAISSEGRWIVFAMRTGWGRLLCSRHGRKTDGLLWRAAW